MLPSEAALLVVDDNEDNRYTLTRRLKRLGYTNFTTAECGREALDLIEQQPFDLVLLDVMMPKLSGFEVCKQLKDDPETSRVMILMVTALNELGDIERAVSAGTDDFLSKPVNKIELLKRVENMLKLKGTEDELERLRQYIQDMEDAPGQGPGAG